jgi:hypothetical protein
MEVALRSSLTRTTVPSRISRTTPGSSPGASSASERAFHASQSLFEPPYRRALELKCKLLCKSADHVASIVRPEGAACCGDDYPGMTMGADQDYEAFLHEWTNDRIWPTGDLLNEGDQQYVVERRAIELIRLAKEKGFADSLAETVGGYGGVTAYVKHLMWDADFKADRSRDS